MFDIITDIRFNPSQHGKMFSEDVELGPLGEDLFHQYAGKRTLEQFKRFKKSSLFKKLYPLAKRKQVSLAKNCTINLDVSCNAHESKHGLISSETKAKWERQSDKRCELQERKCWMKDANSEKKCVR